MSQYIHTKQYCDHLEWCDIQDNCCNQTKAYEDCSCPVHTTATEYYTKLVEIRLVDPMEKKAMESSEEDGEEAWVIQTL
jgi:hypothetical protein